MKNITLTIDDEVLRKAEQKASALDTSVSHVLADLLKQWTVEEDTVQQARQEMSTRFAQSNWQFAVGTPDNREQRNARC